MISIPFLKRKGSTVGLDIGSSLIKAVEIDHSGKRPTITHFGLHTLPPEAIVEGEIMDRDLVVDGIRQCVEKAGVTTNDVVTAVSGRAVIVKKVVMDKMSATDAQEAIFWEAEQHVPFDIDDVCLDFQIVKEDVGANQMEVLLVAAKKDMVNTHASLIRDAGLTPVIIDVDSFAVQNCFEHGRLMSGEVDSNKVVALINIGGDLTNINVVRDSIPLFTRDVSIGSVSFVETIQKEMNVEYAEANTIVSGNIGTHNPSIVKDRIKEASRDLLLGIERSVAFLKAAGDAESIDEIVLSGGGANVPFLKEVISEKYNIPLSIYNPLAAIECREGVFGEHEAEIDKIAPLLMVGIGLALRKAGKE